MVTYKEYKIIQATNYETLQKRVEDAISQGWEPISGIESNVVDGGVEYLKVYLFHRIKDKMYP